MKRRFTFKQTIFFIVNFFCILGTDAYAQKTWVGAGAGGAGTDFNTGSNWDPAGVPGASDNIVISLTSSATVTLSANASVNNLTLSANGNNTVAILSVGANTLTINGTTLVNITAGNANTSSQIGVNGGTSAGVIDFVGSVTISNSTTGSGSGFNGNSNSKFIFRSDLTLGVEAFVNVTNIPGVYEFDGTGSQTITWNNTAYYCEFSNVVIGNTNNPVVNQITGTANPDNILGNLSVNGTSVLNLGTSRWNGGTAGGGTGNAGTLSLNGNAKLQLGSASGGQTGSNFPLRFNSLSIASGSTVEYTGSVAQTIFDIPSPGYGHLTVSNNSVKTAGNALDVRGNLTTNNTATFAGSTFSHNIGGNWSNSGTFTQGTSTIVMNGSSAQQITGSTTTTFNNLTINNTSGGVSLSRSANVAAALTLTNGILTTTSSEILTMNAGSSATFTDGSTTSFVNGPMVKAGNTAFTFPVGKSAGGTGMRAIGISSLSGTLTFTAEFLRAPAPNKYSLGAGITQTSACEYWTLNRTEAAGSAVVTLSWNANSICNLALYVTDLPTLRVARYDNSLTQWQNEGNGSTTGNSVAGTINSSAAVTTFSPFALASSSATTNPLPVKFSFVKAYAQGANNRIEWTNLTEIHVRHYEVEKSGNGTDFHTIQSVTAKGNNNTREDYAETDVSPVEICFYRIKAVAIDGMISYSTIVKVVRNTTSDQLVLYPNPLQSNKQITVQFYNSSRAMFTISVYNTAGVLVKQENWQHPGGSFSSVLGIPEHLNAGTYFIRVSGGGQILTSKFIMQ